MAKALLLQILGFGPTGEPILPPSSHANDLEAIRHDKMSWEAISTQAAKIVSFIGVYTATFKPFTSEHVNHGRFGGP